MKKQSSTESILNHHLPSFGAANMEEILADYTEDSVIFTQDTTAKGIKEIKKIFEGLFAAVPPGSDFNLTVNTINGEFAYIAWDAETPAIKIPLGTDTFHIQDGKIVFQTIAAHIISKKFLLKNFKQCTCITVSTLTQAHYRIGIIFF